MDGLRVLRRRNIALLALMLVLVLAAVSSALLFASRTGQVGNRISYGSVELELVETTVQDGVEVPFTEASPARVVGGELSRIVRVRNTGSHPAFVRLSVTITAVDGSGQEQVLPADLYSIDLNDADWAESGGWYYYAPAALAEGEETAALMTKVEFDHEKLNDVAGWGITLHFRADAVQSENNGGSVWEADGWPADQGGVTS